MFTIEELMMICLAGGVVLLAIYAIFIMFVLSICNHLDRRRDAAETQRRLDIGNDLHPLQRGR